MPARAVKAAGLSSWQMQEKSDGHEGLSLGRPLSLSANLRGNQVGEDVGG